MKGEIGDILMWESLPEFPQPDLMPDLIQEMRKGTSFCTGTGSRSRPTMFLIEKLLKGDIDLMIGNIPAGVRRSARKYSTGNPWSLSCPDRGEASDKRAAGRAAFFQPDLRVLAHLPFVMNTQNDIAGRIGSEILRFIILCPGPGHVRQRRDLPSRMCQNGSCLYLSGYLCPFLPGAVAESRYHLRWISPSDLPGTEK